jgi:exonuclease III
MNICRDGASNPPTSTRERSGVQRGGGAERGEDWGLSVASVNVNGLGKRPLYNDLLQVGRSGEVIGMQETRSKTRKMQETAEHHWVQLNKGAIYWCDPHVEPRGRAHGGVAIAIRGDSGLSEVTHVTILDVPSRYMVLRAKLGRMTVYIHNVYAPNTSREQRSFFRSLPKPHVFESNAKHVIMGDFNGRRDADMDGLRTRALTLGEKEANMWTARFNVVDTWRHMHPDTREYTGPTDANRIDFVLVSGAWGRVHTRTAVHKHGLMGSDHAAPLVRLAASNIFAKKAYWKAKPETLKDKMVRLSIFDHLNSWECPSPSMNGESLIEAFNWKARTLIRKAQTRLDTQDRRDTATLHAAIKVAKGAVKSTPSPTTKHRLKECRGELADYKRLRSQLRLQNAVSKAVGTN